MIIDMLLYLINSEMGKILFLFEFGYIIFRGWGKSPLPLDIFTSNIHVQYIQIVGQLSLCQLATASLQLPLRQFYGLCAPHKVSILWIKSKAVEKGT